MVLVGVFVNLEICIRWNDVEITFLVKRSGIVLMQMKNVSNAKCLYLY